MNDPLIPAAAGHGPVAQRPSAWPARMGVLLVLALTLLLAAATLIHQLPDIPPLHISLNGKEFIPDMALDSMPPAHKVVLAAILVAGLLAAMLIVPMAAMLVLLVVLFVVMLAVGLPLLLTLGVLMLLLSPLLLLGWLLWKLFS